MESVYLETTFISYLVARPSRDLATAAHQQATQIGGRIDDRNSIASFRKW